MRGPWHGIGADPSGPGVAVFGGRQIVHDFVDGSLNGVRSDKAVGDVVDVRSGVTAGGPFEVIGQLGVYFIQGRLHRGDSRRQDVPETAGDFDGFRSSKHECLAPRYVDVGFEDLRLPGTPPHIAQEQLVGLKRHFGSCALWPWRGLPNEQLKRLIAAEKDLLRVAVVAGFGKQSIEAQKDGQPSLLVGVRDIGGNAGVVHAAIDRLASTKEAALAQTIVGLGRRRQLHGQVGDRRMRCWDGPGDDAVDADIGRKMAIGLFEPFEGEIEFGFGHSLAKVEIETVTHETRLRIGKARS